MTRARWLLQPVRHCAGGELPVTELAVTDGMPPPADLPRGEFCCTQLYEDGQRAGIRIDRADPRILISGELLDQIAIGATPEASLRAMGHITGTLNGEPLSIRSYTGAVMKISGVNRTVIYRITGYMPRINGYIGEWPD